MRSCATLSILTLLRLDPRRAGAATVAALMLGGLAGAEPVELSLAQADALAGQALAAGESRLAYNLGKGLLAADSGNPRAYIYQAVALAQAGAHGVAGRKAVLAYWHSETDEQRFEAANLAAQVNFADRRLTGSQFWLRRAVDHAPDEVARDRTVTAFRNVRARNPLRFDLRVSAAPSDNVNNGASSPLNVIDGVPVVGTLSPSAQALSGVITTAQASLSYRIAQSDRRETRLRGRVNTRRVHLSDDVPGLSGDDLSSTVLELGARHIMLGARDTVTWSFDLDGGRVWYGGDPLYDFGRIGTARHQKLGERLLLSFGAEIEEQLDQASRGADSTVYEGFAGTALSLDGGGRLGFRLQYRNTDSNGINRASEQWTGIASYAMGRSLGPATMEFSLGISRLDYSDFRVAFINVPGGREDESIFGSVTARFDDWGYMGFVPTVTVTTENSTSNISRFDVEQTSLTVGMRSEF